MWFGAPETGGLDSGLGVNWRVKIRGFKSWVSQEPRSTWGLV